MGTQVIRLKSNLPLDRWYVLLEGSDVTVDSKVKTMSGVDYYFYKGPLAQFSDWLISSEHVLEDPLKQIPIKDIPMKNLNPTKPDHYHVGKIDVLAFSQENFTYEELKGFYRINIVKYVTRYDKKNGMEDLRKAEDYLCKLMDLEVDTNGR